MDRYNVCCSKDRQGLSYGGFSVVFIQTFSIHHSLQFCVEDRYVDNPDNKRASEAGVPMICRHQDIENQIFLRSSGYDRLEHRLRVLARDGYYHLRRAGARPTDDSVPVTIFPQESVYRFALRGFDFTLPISDEEGGAPETIMSGHVSVEMSIFFGHTVSMTYRFFFDGNAAEVSDPTSGRHKDAVTDDIIALLSTFLAAEYWSKELGDTGPSQTNINLETEMFVDNFWFGDDGSLLEQPRGDIVLRGKGRTFDKICAIYKNFVYNSCTAFPSDVKKEDYRDYVVRRDVKKVHDVRNDLHYAMVDIWENIRHNVPEGYDLFLKSDKKETLSEAEIVSHIRDYHKPELIGLMTMYPGEWPYRDSEAYDDVCGRNVAIDTDDLVLVGSNMSLVIGTYGRRGSESDGVDWEEHLKDRAKYHVSWPEYLLILQMVLAKKYRIGLAKDQLVSVTLNADDESASELIGMNAKLSMRLSRLILQLDVVKYSKFASHVVMFERTTQRLGLERDLQQFREMVEFVDNSLGNLSDYKAMKSDFFLNVVLAIVSTASTFELLFQDSEMPYLTYFGLKSEGIAAWLVAIVAAVTVYAILLVVYNTFRKLFSKIMKK
ncbi:MAG: hypothetical protein IJ005_08720 [Bacteroidales bacterium]|nr:hypothetical protein [Bacteroidales bacterium]